MQRSTRKFVHLTLTAVGIGMVALALAATGSSRANATGGGGGPSNVLVVNSASQPVPTAAQGTTNVAGTVAVSSIPAVTLASGSTVNVANTSASPVPVVVSNELGGGAVRLRAFSAFSGPTSAFQFWGPYDIVPYQVPAGMTLVVDSLSVIATLSAGATPDSADLDEFAPSHSDIGSVDLFDVALSPMGPNRYAWGGALKAYVAGGSFPQFSFTSLSSTNTTVSVHLAGHLVPAGTTPE